MDIINANLTYLVAFLRLHKNSLYAAEMRRRYEPAQMASKTERDQSKRIDELTRQVNDLTEEVDRLSKENADLRRKLKSSSRDSSRPPSSDRYKKPKSKPDDQKREGQTRKRKRGAQPGHKGTQRALVDDQRVDQVVACHPDACACCGGFLDHTTIEGDPDRLQQWDCPPPPPTITEFQRHRHRCPHCTHVTKGRPA